MTHSAWVRNLHCAISPVFGEIMHSLSHQNLGFRRKPTDATIQPWLQLSRQTILSFNVLYQTS